MTNNNCLHNGHRSELSLCDLGTWDWALWEQIHSSSEHLALTLAVSTLKAASALITMRGISGADNADHSDNWQLLMCYSEKLQSCSVEEVEVWTALRAMSESQLSLTQRSVWWSVGGEGGCVMTNFMTFGAMTFSSALTARLWRCNLARPVYCGYCTLPRPAVIATAQLTVVSRSQCHHPITRRKVPP